MKNCMLLLFFLFCFQFLPAQSNLIQNIEARTVQSLNGRWHYIIDPYETGYYNYRRKSFDDEGSAGFNANKKPRSKSDLIEYDFESSPTLKVPGDWNSQDEKLLWYEGTIWYQRDFEVALKQDKKYFLYFGAANYQAHVYVNGTKAGVHKGGFTPFQFDVTALLKNGKNFIVVKVDNVRKKESVPTDNFDWWNYGGITRDVLLCEMPATFILDYKVQLKKADLHTISGFVQLDGARLNQEIIIHIPEAGLHKKIMTDNNGKAIFAFPVQNIQYWSPENPALYTVNIIAATDSIADRIGFRTIETSSKEILLNGKPVFLRGISLHDENPLIPGRPRSKGDLRMLLQWAKELNCNFVRLAHYPHNEAMARLADEMGLLLWEEVPVYWTIAWENTETFENAKQQLSDLVMRDKNRASVIIWSVGNETPVNDNREKFMEGLADHVHALDDTRLVSAALEVHGTGNNVIAMDDKLGNKLDVVSFNEYLGWYTSDLPNDITKYKFQINFNKPVIITEFGADALGGFHADVDTRFSEEYQENFYKNQIKLVSTIDGLCGMTPWVLVDFRSPRRPHPVYQNYWNRKGLLTETGNKKKAWFILKAFYDEMEKPKK